MKTISGQTKTTVYTYDANNQIQTAQENGGTVWQYLFDGNGSLTETRPGSQPGNGAKRYSYDSAGQLVKVEAHDGSGYQPQAEMIYNGLSQRIAVSAYASGQSLTSTYILDGQILLSATAAGETTYYLPGIGEEKQDWTYYLADGPQMFIRYDPDGTWLNFHSSRISGCGEGESWCQLPDARRVQQVRANSITSLTEEMFIDLGKLGPYLDGYDGRVRIAQKHYYRETYWIGVYFANEDQFAKVVEIKDNPLSAPNFEPDSPEASVFMRESYSPINNP